MNVDCLTEFTCALYADGELPARDDREVAEHIEQCTQCRTLVEALRAESRVLVASLQSTDFIEFELEDETLAASQAQNLGVVRFAAFVMAMAVLLHPILEALGEFGAPGAPGIVTGIVVAGAYGIPVGLAVVNSVLNNSGWIALSAILLMGFLLFSRRSAVSSSILSVLALLTVFAPSSYGLDVRSGPNPVTVPSGETLDDTLVVFGDSVVVDGTITGDLIAFARDVTIRGRVNGNVISFARRIGIEGMVDGSAVGFAQTVESRGAIARNIYAFGQRIEMARDSRVDQNAMMFAAESDIEGNIGKDVFTAARSINVAGSARVGGAFRARGAANPDSVRIQPGATIAGPTDIQISQPRPSRYSLLSFYIWQIIWLAAAFLTGLILFWLVPAFSRMNIETSRELLLSAGVGFLALIVTPIAAVIAAITLVGLPLGLITFAFWIVATYLSKIVVAGFLGRSLLAKSGDVNPPVALSLLAGLVPIFLAVNLPYLGTLVNLLLIVLGLGMLVLQALRMPRFRPAQAA